MFNLRKLLYLPIIFMFLPAFTINLPFLGGAYAVYSYFFIFLYVALAVIFILKPNQIINKIIRVIKKTPLKIYLIYVIACILDSIILSAIGVSKFSTTLRYILVHYILCIFPVLIYLTFIIDKYLSFNNFIKLFINLFYIVLILGIIAYMGEFFNITAINSTFDFFANVRIIKMSNMSWNQVTSGYQAYGLPRLDCVFEEPSFYARFLFIFLPLIYATGLSKVRIHKNNNINSIIKRTIIPLTWINLILTQSPIYLVLFFIITALYFSKDIIAILKKYGLFFLSIFIIFLTTILILFQNVDLTDTYLSRIINTLCSLRSFDNFIEVEPSLGCRIVGFINIFIVFLHHPLTGVGIGNLPNFMFHQLLNSPVSLTLENIRNINISILTNQRLLFNSNLFFGDLAQYGFIIFGIFVFYHFTLKKNIDNLGQKNLTYEENVFQKGLSGCWITLTIGYCYHFTLTLIEPLILNALMITFIYHIKNRRNYETNNIHG